MKENPATIRMIDGAVNPTISNVFVNNACAACTLQITGSFTAALVRVEGLVNVSSGEWVPLGAFNLTSLDLWKAGARGAGIYQVGIEGILRVRVNVAELEGGDITVVAQFGNAVIDQFTETEAANLIPVTAYDLAVAGGYSGTLEEFEADMGRSAENAAAAADSAETAEAARDEVLAEKTAAIEAIEAKGEEVNESIPADYSEMTEEVADLKSALGFSEITSVNSGHYVTGTGTYSASSNGRMSDVIAVKAGDKITVDVEIITTTSVGVISRIDDGIYTVLQSSGTSGTIKHYEQKFTESANIVISWLGSYGNVDIKLYSESDIITLFENIINVPDFVSKSELILSNSAVILTKIAGYRQSNGQVASGGMSTYFHADIPVTIGERFILNARDCPTSVCLMGVFDSENENTFHKIKMGTNTSETITIQYESKYNGTLSVSGRYADGDYTLYKTTINDLSFNALLDTVVSIISENINSEVPWQYAIDSILCIGDSLTRGVPPVTSTMPNPMKQCYPWYLSRMINSEVTNAGVGGINTMDWYNNQYPLYQMSNYNAIIVFLGTNGGLTDTLDTDVEPYDSYSEYANTNTGCYCKLIENIIDDNDNCIIILVKPWHLGASYNTTREVIDKIGDRYNLPVIDTMDIDYSINPEYHGNHDNVHCTKAGYLALAHKICNSIKAYVSENINYANNGMTRQNS